MGEAFWIETEDWHTAGEPFRIVPSLPVGSLTSGLTVAEERLKITSTPDHPLDLLRQSLCHEPRGHADMYGGFILPPNNAGAHFGVLFWHKDGFSTACGHGTIALGTWAVHKALVPTVSDIVDVVIDVPSGRVTARAIVQNGQVQHIDFINVASYLVKERLAIEISVGTEHSQHANKVGLNVDLAVGGALYASLDISTIGLQDLVPTDIPLLISVQKQIKDS